MSTHCNKLQHIATQCNTLRHAATQVSTGVADVCRHTATLCNTLQHTATHCNTGVADVCRHTATHCNTLQHTATHCNTLQHAATQVSLTYVDGGEMSYVTVTGNLVMFESESEKKKRWRDEWLLFYPEVRACLHVCMSLFFSKKELFFQKKR